jgi:hypothetical protein
VIDLVVKRAEDRAAGASRQLRWPNVAWTATDRVRTATAGLADEIGDENIYESTERVGAMLQRAYATRLPGSPRASGTTTRVRARARPDIVLPSGESA